MPFSKSFIFKVSKSMDCVKKDLTLSQTTNFRFFQNEGFADDNFKFDESSRQFSLRVKNTVRKQEIACYEQLLFFPQCFQKKCTADM